MSFILQDWQNNKGNTKGRIVAICFRLANLARKNRFVKLLLFPYLIFYKLIFEWIIGFELPYDTQVGAGLKVYHLQAIVINKSCKIGKNCQLRQSLTIGNKEAGGRCPVIGDNVDIGSNVCIIGDILIGSNAKIGAGSVVIKNVPANSTAVGNPARIINAGLATPLN